MSKEITKARILQEIQDKFGLREFEAESFLFGERVTPVYDIAPHVQKWTTEYKSVSITSMSHFVLFAVPQNEKWHLRRYDVIFMGAGAYTIAGVFIHRGTDQFIYLDLEAAQTVSYHVSLSQDAILNPGDSIRVNADGYTSTQDLRLYIDVMKEEIR